jgi:outer membrane protein
MAIMFNFSSISAAILMALLISIWPTRLVGQVEGFSTSDILQRLKSQEDELPPTQTVQSPWWEVHVVNQMLPDSQPIPADLEMLTRLTLQNSTQVKVYSEIPLIRETAIEEADAAFDSVRYLETLWEDVDVPVGSSLTVGGSGTRFSDHNLNVTAGVRRRTARGIELDLSQRLGHQNSNSNFFVPNDQGSARLNFGLTIPLMRGRGKEYNQSLVVLAGIDTEMAEQEFLRQLQSHLLEVNRAYWSLFMERSALAQQVSLYLKTSNIYNQLVARQRIDAQQSQLASAQAALSNRRSDLVRAETAVKNAETRLRALINAEELGDSELAEIIPSQLPLSTYTSCDITAELETGIQYRPEIIAAVKDIKAGSVRLNMARNEMLPLLNMITQFYISGLQGDSDLEQAWVDQFGRGAPSYSVGFNYEVPIGNRASRARAQRRQLELRQLQEKYQAALENVKAEIEIAVRELNASYRELNAKNRARKAANIEAQTLEARWNQMVNGNGTAGLSLIALLEAQERVARAEFEFSNSQLVYNLAMANLKRANGTLLQAEAINVERGCRDNVPETILDKAPSPVAARAARPAPARPVIADPTRSAVRKMVKSSPVVKLSPPRKPAPVEETASAVGLRRITKSQSEYASSDRPVVSSRAAIVLPKPLDFEEPLIDPTAFVVRADPESAEEGDYIFVPVTSEPISNRFKND